MESGKPAIVRQLPERFIKGELDEFCRQVEALLGAERPWLVFDFSAVKEIDRYGAEMLVACLKQALKANGDIKLASIPAAPEVILELTGASRVFEAYPNVFEAVQSFQRHSHEIRSVEQLWPAAQDRTSPDRLPIAG